MLSVCLYLSLSLSWFSAIQLSSTTLLFFLFLQFVQFLSCFFTSTCIFPVFFLFLFTWLKSANSPTVYANPSPPQFWLFFPSFFMPSFTCPPTLSCSCSLRHLVLRCRWGTVDGSLKSLGPSGCVCVVCVCQETFFYLQLQSGTFGVTFDCGFCNFQTTFCTSTCGLLLPLRLTVEHVHFAPPTLSMLRVAPSCILSWDRRHLGSDYSNAF